MKRRGAGFRPRLSAPQTRDVSLARLTFHEGGEGVACSCGWGRGYHPRRRILEDAAQRHLDKRHGGRALWL